VGFREVLAALRRNAVVIVGLLIVTAAGTGYVWAQVPVTYESDATMIVLLPTQSGAAGSAVQVNPYLNVGAQSTQVAASALANVSGSDEFVAALRTAGVTSVTTVHVAVYGGGVVLELAAVNPSGDAASRDLEELSRQLSEELGRRQREAGAPDGTYMTVTDLTEPSNAIPLTSSRTKLAGVAAAIGLLVTVAVVVVLEGGRRANPRPLRDTGSEASSSGESRRPERELQTHAAEAGRGQPVPVATAGREHGGAGLSMSGPGERNGGGPTTA
jgi:hypothetical protein